MKFKDAVKLLRNELGLSQAELAAGLQINAITVGRWENGKTKPPRSLASLLMNFARSKGASKECLQILTAAINTAAREKLDFSDVELAAVEKEPQRQLIDDAPFPIYVSDLETYELLYLNQKARAMATEADDAIGKKCYACLMRRETPCEFCHKRELIDGSFTGYDVLSPFDGLTCHMQGKLIQWNGHIAQLRLVLWQGLSPELSFISEADGIESLVTDSEPVSGMTMEVLIRQSIENEKLAEQIKTIFEKINGGISVVVYEDTGALRLAYANDQYYELFGYSREQFFKELKSPHDTTFPDDRPKVSSIMTKVKETRQSATFRYRIMRRDGSIAYVRCNSSVATVKGISGNVLISVLTDISESVEMEQQALVSGRRLDAIMKNMNSAVTASLLKNDSVGELLFSNDLFYKMQGWTKEQYQAEVSDPFALVHPEDTQRVREEVFSLRRIGDEKLLQYRILTRDGKIRWFSTRISVMTFPDVEEPVLLAIYSDVTDIVEAREKLAIQNKQMKDLLDDTPSGIAIIEVNPADMLGSLHTTYFNDRFFSYSGYDRDGYEAQRKDNELAFVFDEDIPTLLADTQKLCAGEIGVSVDNLVRCHTKAGGFRWLLLTAQLVERRGDISVVIVALVDVTERQTAVDRQRIREEMFRVAAETDDRILIIYDVKNNSCRVESRTPFLIKYRDTFENVPQSFIDLGIVAADSAQELSILFERIRKGEQKISVSLQMRCEQDKYEWFECNAGTIFNAEGLPDHAVLVFHNITEQLLREAVFRKWQQSIDQRPAESYTLFRCNLSKDVSLDEQDGSLLNFSFPPDVSSVKSRIKLYVEACVCPDDREALAKLLDADSLLAMFYRGERTVTLDFRETARNGEELWRRLTVETVEEPNSPDVQAFLLIEDIDAQKKVEIAEQSLAETDPLTGALKREAFVEKVNSFISANPNSNCALIMLDMDGLKNLIHLLGYVEGDKVLQEVTAILRSYAGNAYLISRLASNEFLIWLQDVPYDAVIGRTAQQICEHIHNAYNQEAPLNASVGIAVYPRDGQNFDELFQNADSALYNVVRADKGSYAFFSVVGDEQRQEVREETPEVMHTPRTQNGNKYRILIVDDNETNRLMLSNFFKDDYLIEIAKNGAEALICLRHYGTFISVVLLDLLMPGIDGFGVLRKMQSDVDLRTIPVIVVTGDEDHSTLLKAFELGAAEYVTKPVDLDIIRMRVKSVLTKTESERLRAQNSYLTLQRNAEEKYRTVLESTGTVVIEYDWLNQVFVYDGEISRHIAGKYDHRGLWQVFLADMVADSVDVQSLHDKLHSLANNRELSQDSMLIKLKTPEKLRHWFRVNIFKRTDDFGLTEKIIFTFNDVHDEVLANNRLLFQATRDELTGLYNRAGFFEKAAELIAAREPGFFVLDCVDIEKFKVINDQYGTDTGDEILTKFAHELAKYNDDRSFISCRIMADNFAVLHPAKMIDSQELKDLHTLILNIDDAIPNIQFAVGRCFVENKAIDVGAIYDHAFIAKSTVKGRYDVHIATYDESMRTDLLRQQEIIAQMKNALESGQFEVWLQPQFNHTTGMLSGAEALVRWCHPLEGIISPAEFIPIFERNGFIYEVDKYVWECSCKMLRKWLDQGLNPVPISVNISRSDVFRTDIISIIEGLIEKYELPIEMLRLEITESAFSQSAEQIIKVVETLVEKGFTVEIDDFGSGYSSLNTLKDVPAQVLKMDMRFLENDRNSQRGGSIIESVVRMAKWLGMSVIAEGVETIEQADYLKSIGCKYIQGYLYSRPTRAEEYEKLFEEGRVESIFAKLYSVETWNNNAFWNPASMETLIFNSYVGGACIFEFCNGKTELLRVNERYYGALGSLVQKNTPLEEAGLWQFLRGEEDKIALDNLLRTIQSTHEESAELCLTDGINTEFIRVTGRLIARGENRYLFYAVIQNITEQCRLERERTESAERLSIIMSNVNGGVSAVQVFDDGSSHIVFCNHKYFELYGITSVEKGDEPDPMSFIIPEDLPGVIEKVKKLKTDGQPVVMDYGIIRQDGSRAQIRANSSLMTMEGYGPIITSVLMDVTEQITMEEQLRFLNESASGILAQPDSQKAITNALQKLLLYFEGERTYVFELNDETKTTNNTYEICAPGVSPEIERLQNVPYDTQQYWFDAFSKDGFIAIPDVSAIEDSEVAMREILLVQNIHSIIVAPLWRDGRLIGYLGVDNPSVAVNQVSQLIGFSDYVAVLLTRRDLMLAIERERQTAQQLMDDTPGGFLRLELFKDNYAAIETVNDGLCKMLDMTKAEVMEKYGADVYACLADEDAAMAREKLAQGYASDGQYTSTVRLRKKDGSLIWAMLFGRFVRGEEGKLYLNAYFTDITVQRSIEQLQSELLDNLPFGAAMYEYDGKTLTAIHINRQYAEMVRRKVDISIAGFDSMSAIHPDDRKRVFDEIRSAIVEKRNASSDVRLLYGDGEYVLFHLDARIVSKKNGKYLLYVAYEHITDKEKELKETSERLKLLSDSIPGGIATFRCKPDNLESIYFNDGICDLTGYSREEFNNSDITFLGLIFDEDMPVIRKQLELLMNDEMALDYAVRIHTKSGGYKWVECMASVTGKEAENVFIVSAVVTDVTEHQEEREHLRISEELNRLAIDQSGNIISRYDVATRTLMLPYQLPAIFNSPRVLENVPEDQVRFGHISPETADSYRGVFTRINNGETSGEAIYQQYSTLGWRWLKSRFTTVFTSDGKPVSAVITLKDITEQREKEAIYSRWQNAMSERPKDSYTIVRCNLTQTNIIDSWEGSLLRINFTNSTLSFNSRTDEYTEHFVYLDDRAVFRAFLNSDTMLAEYHRGHRNDSLDYRELNEDGSVRWLRLTVDLVEYPDSTDVEAYLLFENIDEQKQTELFTLWRAETDPLTGVFNRVTFAQHVNHVISQFGTRHKHVFFLLDVDGFKQVNDVFGHGAGDQVIIDIANALTHFCRKDDVVGRLGGDEFFVFLSDIGSAELASLKAQHICNLTRKTLSDTVHISTSIGIALYPQDGDVFEELYKVADAALYRAKNAGKDGYSFSFGEPVIGIGAPRRDHQLVTRHAKKRWERARRILIIEDNNISLQTLEGMLRQDYDIEIATDGASALEMLSHYGTAISVVLLDLMMPGISGFELLEKMQQDERTRLIPVIVISSAEDRARALQVIRAGASDLVMKPVDTDMLHIRLESAISKAENERLRAQNSYLEIRDSAVKSYRAALECTGTMLVVLDWESQQFSYSSIVSEKLAGKYDDRPLWNILLADGVSDEQTVQEMRNLVQTIEEDRERTQGSLRARLKSRGGITKYYEMNVFKELDDYGLTSKMIMTLREADSTQSDS